MTAEEIKSWLPRRVAPDERSRQHCFYILGTPSGKILRNRVRRRLAGWVFS